MWSICLVRDVASYPQLPFAIATCSLAAEVHRPPQLSWVSGDSTVHSRAPTVRDDCTGEEPAVASDDRSQHQRADPLYKYASAVLPTEVLNAN
jgi:hypothetical protein